MSAKAFEVVTERIIKILETGSIPWRQPWSQAAALGQQQNAVSKHQYKGINALMTYAVSEHAGYRSPLWLTYKQAQTLKGQVRKGEKGTPIVFWKFSNKVDDDGTERKIGFASYSMVFNTDQVDGLDVDSISAKRPKEIVFSPIEACANVLKTYENAPTIEHVQQRAFYKPSTDVVNMPRPETFKSVEAYYSVLFHELTHSTGHTKRLARPGVVNVNHFGSHEYSKEELVAEMGAAFLCAKTGIDNQTVENSAAYLASWLKVLKSDSRMLMSAASQAQKASDLILGIKQETKEEVES